MADRLAFAFSYEIEVLNSSLTLNIIIFVHFLGQI